MINQEPYDIIEIGGVKYQRIVEEQKPQTLYDRLSKSLDGRILLDYKIKDTVCDIVNNWLPDELEHKSVDSYSSGWNDCLNRLRLTLK
jgi:hypothetical protein